MIKNIKYFVLLFIFMSTGILNAADRLSWLPDSESKTKTIAPDVNKFLNSLNGRFRILGCRYNEALLTECKPFDQTGLQTSEGKWAYNLNASQVKGEKDALDLILTVKHFGGDISSAGVAVAFDFSGWSPENYVMIPASVYNGNRNRIVDRAYATGFDKGDYYRKDLPLTTVALPQLSPNPDSLSRIEVNTSYTSTPAICFFDKTKKRGFILLTEQGMENRGKTIDHGLIVEESADRKMASFIISAPGVLEKKPEFIGFSKSPYRGIEWKQEDEMKLRVRLYTFKAASIPELLEKFMTVRKEVIIDHSPRNLIPFSETLRLMTQDIDKRFYQSEVADYYCPENATWISFGWIGGLMNTFPMLALGDEQHRSRVFSTFDFAISRAQAATGYFYSTLGEDGKVFGRDGSGNTPEVVLTRQNADVLFWMLKQFFLLKTQGYLVNPIWEESILHQADAFVSTWKKHGQWGNFLDIKTGDIAVYNTAGGVMAIGGLVLAAAYYDNSVYLETAKEAASFYFNDHFIKLGMTTGGCGDILQNADSETAVAFMTSLMALYEATGQKDWLDKSRQLANLCATWTASYNYRLPENTPLAKLEAKLTGVVWASTQNKHGAPGFCCSSGDPLFKIYRATGDERYAKLMYDIVHAHAEGIQPNGQITERLTYCDADSKGDRLEGGKTGWNETNGALMALELPGIYLRTDIDRLFVFDHMNVKITKQDQSGVTLQITNPTAFDASVSILTENAEQASKPLGYTSFLNWKKVPVKAGETIIEKISK